MAHAAVPRLTMWAPVVAYMAIIFWSSSLSTVPPLPGGVSYYEAHVFVYAGLGALMARAVAKGVHEVPMRAVVIAALLSSFYGVSDEIHQRFVPGRAFDYFDIAADAAGSAIGAASVGAWSIIRRVSQT